VGKTIDDDELVGYILSGLDDIHDTLVLLVNVVASTILADLFGQSSSFDMRYHHRR
jgi:hypothetical protein